MLKSEKTILYVDDDADDRELLTNVMKSTHPEIDVVLSENGKDALGYLLHVKNNGGHLPSLIVLDINMPYLDGKETLEMLQKDGDMQRIPVIIFSSSEKPADKNLFSNMGVPFYSKPTTISSLGHIVTQMVKNFC